MDSASIRPGSTIGWRMLNTHWKSIRNADAGEKMARAYTWISHHFAWQKMVRKVFWILGLNCGDILGCRGNYAVGRRADNQNNTLTFVNLETGKTMDGPKNLYDIRLTGDYAVGSVLDESDFEVRGTYLINMKEGTFTRVSAYPAQSTSDNWGARLLQQRFGDFAR